MKIRESMWEGSISISFILLKYKKVNKLKDKIEKNENTENTGHPKMIGESSRYS